MGIFFGFLSAALGSAKDIFNKKIALAVSGNLSAFASFLFPLPIYVVLLALLWGLGIESFEVKAGFFLFVALRAFTDCFAESFKMHALSHGELSLVSSLIALYPLFVLLFSPTLTNDALNSGVVLGVFLTVAGNLVLFYKVDCRPSRNAVIFALLSAAFMGLNICFDRMSVQRASPIFSAFAMTLLSCVLLLPTLFWEKNVTTPIKLALVPLCLRAVFEVSFMVLKLCALQTLTSAQLAAILRVTLIITVIGGKVLFKELGFTRKMIGAILTSIGVAIIVLQES